MKSTLFIILGLTASAHALKLTDPLSRDQEARAIENAVLDRTVGVLDDELSHPKDQGSHSGARAAMRGVTFDNEQVINKMGPLEKFDPILGLAAKRIKHPMY